jgi:hypothetical protein
VSLKKIWYLPHEGCFDCNTLLLTYIDKAISKNNLFNIYGTMPIMEAFKLPNIGTLFWQAKNVNQIFRNGN